MKRLFALLLALAMALTGCGGRDDRIEAAPQPGDGPEAAGASDQSASLVPLDGAPELAETVSLDFGEADASKLLSARSMPGEGGIDLDLASMSGTVVYSQVFQMMTTPEAYVGATIRIRGDLDYFKDEETNREYFAAIIQDATACCAQGIEFVWKGQHSYPRDYPPLGTELTVTGTFDTYEENGNQYIQLLDADVSWEGMA